MTGTRNLDLSLYLVTDAQLCGTYGVAETVAAAISSGVTAVQLRDATATDRELTEIGRSVLSRLRGTSVPLIVDDRVHLVGAIGADGAHIGQSDLSAVEARSRLGPKAILGLSVQTLTHVAVARCDGHNTVDYLGVGPIWPQDTKPDAAPPGGLATLATIVTASPWPCVAIGGIDHTRAAAVRATGAAGVAVVSAICGRPSVTEATRQLRRAWDDAAPNPQLRPAAGGGRP